ncbi:hypothetical protein [Bradyrhizobium lablabi]|uniref:hypothetical protein n=1 Tax=Bradyrhizobium lablabi TaxID=722472 RepID=UPI001BA73D43|nr:hypothetical protein [Bradyrhizobium lablabi]MBR0696159.1 hypothetical protein [Bradyrhizobium lablabi]
MQRHDWLDVERLLGAVERPSVEICIALERNADEIGDRILRLFGEVFVFGGFGRTVGSCRRDRVAKAALEFDAEKTSSNSLHFTHLWW